MVLMKNKGIINAVIPAILFQCASGSVYCFSVYRDEIMNILNTNNISWFFTMVIGMLGLFAAFSGRLVEKNVRFSSLLACLIFFSGMIIIPLGLYCKSYFITSIGFIILGCGTGISYLCPVKTLALHFPKNKGFATSISIASFGISKALVSPIMLKLQNNFGIINMFLILAVVFLVMMFIGHLLLKKPTDWEEIQKSNKIKIKNIILNNGFIIVFIMFLISITNGLVFIGCEKQIINLITTNANIISIILFLTALSNCLGRICFSSLTDRLNKKFGVYVIMAALGIFAIIGYRFGIINLNLFSIIVSLCLINAIYGGFFSVLVPVILEFFGIKNLSTIHSLELIAWSLGAVFSTLLLQKFSIDSEILFNLVFYLYTFSALIGLIFYKIKGDEE